MLHEILLSLSGHPSPLLSTHGKIGDTDSPFQSLLSPAERALLQTLAQDLGERHKNIRSNASTISSSHPSIVCRAVSAAIVATHLAAFQRRILEVERDILEADANLVGAYNIVPLSAIVGAFDGWARKLEWLWEVVQFIQAPPSRGLLLPGGSSKEPSDERLTSKDKGNKASKAKQSLETALASMTIKEGEVSAVLARTWTALASLQSLDDDDDVDEELDQARDIIRLSIKSPDADLIVPGGTRIRASTVFDDLLLPSSTTLTFQVPSPLDLFLTNKDVDTYSHIHSYLLAIRRAHFRLSSATFLLAELGEYFQGEVVKSSWTTFHSWLVPKLEPPTPAGDVSLMSSIGSAGRPMASRPTSSRASNDTSSQVPHDPETLMQAHRRYLSSLENALLLHDSDFTALLRRLLTSIDHLSALMQRLNTIQQSLDAETGIGLESVVSNLAKEEQRLVEDLHTSRQKVAACVQGLIETLRVIDNARPEKRGFRGSTGRAGQDGFVPWAGGGVDRLLLKFEHGNSGGGRLGFPEFDQG
ncbi:hypothetical protein P7C71_g5638, partial [Lecanoromycetidae sp. Uapishka_2]